MPEGKNFKALHSGPLETLRERVGVGARGKYMLGAELGLTGCEVSMNRLPAGKSVPFLHAHQHNEELYIVVRGSGTFHVDGEEFPIAEGSVIRVDPAGERAWKAGDEVLYFICIQTERGSLQQATRDDGIILESKASWMTS
jgi:mannose-6-phosphate isomerase-like protein (cupin superfamily)